MHNELIKIRKQIDRCDKKILNSLEKRFVLIQKIHAIKKKEKLPIRDIKREEYLLQTAKQNTSSKYILKIYTYLLKESLKYLKNQ